MGIGFPKEGDGIMKVENLRNRPIQIDGITINPGETKSVSEEANVSPLLKDGLIKVYNAKIEEQPKKSRSKKEEVI